MTMRNIADLPGISMQCAHLLTKHGYIKKGQVDLQQLKSAFESGEIYEIRGIGPMRLAEIQRWINTAEGTTVTHRSPDCPICQKFHAHGHGGLS